MSRRARALVVALVVLVALGGVAAWYLTSGSDPQGPALPARTSGGTGAGATSADGRWTVAEDGSFVGYRISERFVGGLADIEAVGRTSDVRGGLTVEGRAARSVSIEADLGTLTSDKAPRDNYLTTNALETGTFPTARFVASGPIDLPVLTRGEEFERTIEGVLTLHGVTRPLSLPVTARWDGTAVFVIGTAPIVLADYGIATPQTPVVSVQDRGSLEIQLVLRRS